MKKLEDLNHYEMLDIAVSASHFEIRQAYKDALSTYNEESLITYSLFSDAERAEIIEKIEAAFSTLIDEKARADYDKMLEKSGKLDGLALNSKEQKRPIPLFRTQTAIDEDAFFERIRKRIDNAEVKETVNQILSKKVVLGNDLKKLRESMGIDLEEIFEVSRISVNILQSIEEGQIETLPSKVYLKNFLKIYAEILHIDSKRTVEGYLKNIQSFQEKT
jgi:DnaJ-class molecular chaperone